MQFIHIPGIYVARAPKPAPAAALPRFATVERLLLLSEPGIGERVIESLEAAGVHGIEQLARRGVREALLRSCAVLGTRWQITRTRALERAVQRALPLLR